MIPCIYTLNRNCWLHIKWLICMLSGLNIWNSTATWCAVPYHCSQRSSVAHSSPCRAEASWVSPVQSSMSFGVILVQLIFGQSHCWDLMGVDSHISRRQSYSKSPDLLALIIFPWCQYGSVLEMDPLGVSYTGNKGRPACLFAKYRDRTYHTSI